MAEQIIERQGSIRRIKTYIEGLDENMEGGIPQGHITLICGSAGTMKTSLCFNVLYNEALLNNKIGIYISLEQAHQSLINHFINMGFDLTKINLLIIKDLTEFRENILKLHAAKKGGVIIVDLGCIRKEIKDVKITSTTNPGWLNVIKNIIKKVKTEVGCDLFVIDSLSALYVLSKFENPRVELFYVFEFLRDADITSFLISEMPLDGSKYSEYGVEDYLADGIIHIKLSQFRRDVMREISIVKMRSTDCNNDIFSLEYKKGKFLALYGGQTPLV